jgi:hypothetical protein
VLLTILIVLTKGYWRQIWDMVTSAQSKRTCPFSDDPEQYGQKSYIMVQIIVRWDIAVLEVDLRLESVVTRQ